MKNNEKTIDELTIEIQTLIEENARLKEKVGKTDVEVKVNTELETLKSDNKSLRELNEKLQAELKGSQELTSRVLREYSTKEFKEPETEQEKEQSKALEDFSNFIKNI